MRNTSICKVDVVIVHISMHSHLKSIIRYYFYSISVFSAQTPEEYEREYDNKQQLMHMGASKFHGFAYDGTWVIAKVLTRVMETVKYRERYSIHRNFTVTDQEMSEMILEAIEKINFFGVTVCTMFHNSAFTLLHSCIWHFFQNR